MGKKILFTCAKVTFANSSDLQLIPGKLKMICSLHMKITGEQLFVCCLKKKTTVASKYVQVNPASSRAKVIEVPTLTVSLDVHIDHNVALTKEYSK